MDYDQSEIARTYDAGRRYSAEGLALWLDRIAMAAPPTPKTILDLGSGTGRFSAALADRFGAQVVGLDRSKKMLSEARRKAAPRVGLLRGSAEAIPVRDETFDLVFLSMVLHHFERPEDAARECRRVLAPGGVVCLRAGTIERIATYAYVPFFPTSVPLMEAMLQTHDRIASIFRAGGLEMVRHEEVPSPLAASWSEYADKLALRADSILVQLGDRDFDAGMAKLRAHAARAKGPVEERVDFFAFAVR